MASNSKIGEKQPVVLSSNFRMVTEKMIGKFIDSSDEVLEFPMSLSRDQRMFIENYIYKFGLKSKIIGKGLTARITVFKSEESKMNAASAFIDLRTRSKKVIHKMLEILSDKSSNPQVQQKTEASTNQPSSMGVHSKLRNDVSISIPSINFNENCTAIRENLPIFHYRDEILRLVDRNQIVIVESTTGSGKSTQIPQYILEEASVNKLPCRIIVAEPKRICATTLAERVSFERGDAVGSTVGYQIRLESKVSPTSNLIYVTNGVILRMLMSGRPHEFFQSITHLIIDEAHERDKFGDFLLLTVREFMHINPNLKIIIMSATLDSNLFQDYFNGCPVLKAEGRCFEVEEMYLEDILRLLNYTNEKVQDMHATYDGHPDLLNQAAESSTDVENLEDDTKDIVNAILTNIATDSDCEFQFPQIYYMVKANHIPIDIRHIESSKTALMFAVEQGLEAHVTKLLNMKANPALTVVIDGKELNAVDIALAKNDEKMAKILQNHLELNEVNHVKFDEGTISSPMDRMLLDIYYDSLVQPGIRGVFLEDIVDHSLIVHLIRHLHFNTDTKNAILVFLPGHDNIVQLANLLYNALDTNYEIFILHSQMQTADQTNVFEKMPEGSRKIILSTNIAESSITVNDVVYVIDSGKEKEASFNAMTHISSLRAQWISKASAKQRMGRAGRVREGVVYRMYSRDRFNYFVEKGKPEILRCDLTDICLQAKMIARPGESITNFLKKAITPPNEISVYHSIKILQQLGALEYDETLTQLGRYLADIPLNAKYGKMLIYGIFFKCIDPILTIVSILSISEPFTIPTRNEDREMCYNLKRSLEDGSYSDHFVLLRIFQKWNEYKTTNEFDDVFCEDNFCNPGTMDRIASTRLKIVGSLRSVRLIQSVGNLAAANEFSNKWSVIKACLAAGSYPDIARVLKKHGEITTAVDEKICVNPGSVLRPNSNSKLSKETMSLFPSEWMIFEEKNQAGMMGMAKICTLVTGVSLALTAGHGICINDDAWSEGDTHEDSIVEMEIDKFIKFAGESTVIYMLHELRAKLNALLTRFLLNVDRFRYSEYDEILIEGIAKILELEDEKAGFKTDYPGIGARPRVITRSYGTTKVRREMDVYCEKTDYDSKLSLAMAPPVTQKPVVEHFKETGEKNYYYIENLMRYFMVELDEKLVKNLKTKICVFIEADAKLPNAFIDSLIEFEVNDRVSRKTMIFHSNEEIVGVGMLMDHRDKQFKRENLKMFFQSDKRFDLQRLRIFCNETNFDKMFEKPFAEIRSDVGKFCVDTCMNK